jgi:hypothetical protein
MRGGISIGAVLLPIHREPGARSSVHCVVVVVAKKARPTDLLNMWSDF